MRTWQKVAIGVGTLAMVGVAVTWTREARAMEIGKLLRTSGYAPAPNVLAYAVAVDVVSHESGKPYAIDWCLQEQAAGRAVLIPKSMYEGKLPKPGYPSSLISVPPERVDEATKNGEGYAAGRTQGIQAFNDHAVSIFGQSPEFHRKSCKCNPENLLEGPYAIDATKPLLWKTSFRAGFIDGWNEAKAGS